MAFPGFDSPAYGTIGGALPWGGGGSAASAIYGAGTGNIGQIAGAYGTAYNNALAMNQSNYNNILSGYQKVLAQNNTAQSAIQAGYSNLYNDVMAKISGIGQARANEIKAQSARDLAKGSQQLIDRGLGNTTVQSSFERGVSSDRARQETILSDQLAQTLSQYMSSLGLAGLANQERGVQSQNAISQAQLNWMNSVNAQYPDASLYANLARQAGMGGGGGGGGYGGGAFFQQAPKLGYVPASYGGYTGTNPYVTGQGSYGGWLADQEAMGMAAAASGGWQPQSISYDTGGGNWLSNVSGNIASQMGGQSAGNWLSNVSGNIASQMGGYGASDVAAAAGQGAADMFAGLYDQY